MKTVTLVMGLFASLVSAQAVNNCTLTSTLPGIQTITDIITSTYCPVCDSAKSTGGVYTTVYETEYLAVCPTGLTSSVYTVTNTCTGTTPIDTSTCPPGFTTTTVGCNCPASSTVTITTPIGASETAPVTATSCATEEPVTYTTTGEPITYVSAGVTVTSTPALVVTSTPAAVSASAPASFTGAAASMSNNLGALALGLGSVFFGVIAL